MSRQTTCRFHEEILQIIDGNVGQAARLANRADFHTVLARNQLRRKTSSAVKLR